MRKAALALVAAAAITVGLVGCSSPGPVKGTVAAAPVVHTATATPKPTPSKAVAALGTRSNPFPVGTPGKYDQSSMWTFKFAATNTDGWDAIQNETGLAPAPPAGTKDIIVSVTISAGATQEAENPYDDVDFNYVGSDGNTYPADDACGYVLADGFENATAMYSGASRTYTVCSQVPDAAISGGAWTANYSTGESPTAFFKGA
jgi:hypothetical protein